DARAQRDAHHGGPAGGVPAQHPKGIVAVIVDAPAAAGGQRQEPQHVTARERRDQRLFRIDRRLDRQRHPHHLRRGGRGHLDAAAMAQAVGTPALVLAAWVAAGVVAMLGALCFAELGALLPEAGGEYVYLRAAFGEVPGFLYACNSFVLGGASIAAYGAAVAIFVSDIHTFDKQWFAHTLHLFGADYSWQFGTRQLIAIGVIGVFAAINCAGVMVGGRVQTLLAVAKVAAIIAV